MLARRILIVVAFAKSTLTGTQLASLKYNGLALLQVLVGLLQSVLIVKFFGVSEETDAYFIASAIVGSLQLVMLLLIDMFMQYYNELKRRSKESAIDFYSSVAGLSLLTGILSYAALYLFMDQVAQVFASGIDKERLVILKDFLPLVGVSLLFANFSYVNTNLLNAEFRFAFPYIFLAIPSMFGIVAILSFGAVHGVRIVAYATIASGFVVFLLRILYTRYCGIRIRPSLWHEEMPNLIRKSIAMRTGHNMHNFIKEPITTNVLSYFEAGIASRYYYALRIMSVVLGVTTGPLLQIYWAKTSNLFASNDFRGIKKLIRKTEPELLALYIISAVAVLALISPMLTMLESRSLSHDDVESIQALYMALIPLYVVGTFETPFGYVLVAAKAALKVMFINSTYILLYGLLVTFLVQQVGIYAIPISLILAQSSNTTLVTISAVRILNTASQRLFLQSITESDGR